MNGHVTTKELEDTLDKKFEQYQTVIVEAIDSRFIKWEEKSEERFQGIEKRFDSFGAKLDRLTTTLDNFLKRLTDREEEMKLMQADISRIKAVLKEKLGVEVLI